MMLAPPNPNATYVIVDPNQQLLYTQQQQQAVIIQQQPMYIQQPQMMQPQYVMQQPAQTQQLNKSQKQSELNKSYGQGQPILQAQSYPVNNNFNNDAAQYQGNGFNYQQGQGRAVFQSDYQRDLPNNANGAYGPCKIQCPFCQKPVTTQMETASGTGTYIACCLLFCITGWCCCLPFFVDDCKDKIYKCPSCKQVVGIREYKII